MVNVHHVTIQTALIDVTMSSTIIITIGEIITVLEAIIVNKGPIGKGLSMVIGRTMVIEIKIIVTMVKHVATVTMGQLTTLAKIMVDNQHLLMFRVL